MLLNVNKETENFKRFNNKMIISCVISLDKKDIYTINWSSIIQDKQKFLKDKLYNILYGIFNIKHVEYYNSFKHISDKDPSKSPLKILEACITKIEGKLSYISDTFKWIKMDMERNSKHKKKILEQYTNKNNFITLLNERLESSLKNYLGLSEDEEEEEEEEEEEDNNTNTIIMS
jgi:hypothetical protein